MTIHRKRTRDRLAVGDGNGCAVGGTHAQGVRAGEQGDIRAVAAVEPLFVGSHAYGPQAGLIHGDVVESSGEIAGGDGRGRGSVGADQVQADRMIGTIVHRRGAVIHGHERPGRAVEGVEVHLGDLTDGGVDRGVEGDGNGVGEFGQADAEGSHGDVVGGLGGETVGSVGRQRQIEDSHPGSRSAGGELVSGRIEDADSPRRGRTDVHGRDHVAGAAGEREVHDMTIHRKRTRDRLAVGDGSRGGVR